MMDGVKLLKEILLSDACVNSDALEFQQMLATKSAAFILGVPSVKSASKRAELIAALSPVLPDAESRLSSTGDMSNPPNPTSVTKEAAKKASEAIQVIERETEPAKRSLTDLFSKLAGTNALLVVAAPIVALAAQRRMSNNSERDKYAMAVLRRTVAQDNQGASVDTIDYLTKSACQSIYTDEAVAKLLLLQDAVLGMD